MNGYQEKTKMTRTTISTEKKVTYTFLEETLNEKILEIYKILLFVAHSWK